MTFLTQPTSGGPGRLRPRREGEGEGEPRGRRPPHTPHSPHLPPLSHIHLYIMMLYIYTIFVTRLTFRPSSFSPSHPRQGSHHHPSHYPSHHPSHYPGHYLILEAHLGQVRQGLLTHTFTYNDIYLYIMSVYI